MRTGRSVMRTGRSARRRRSGSPLPGSGAGRLPDHEPAGVPDHAGGSPAVQRGEEVLDGLDAELIQFTIDSAAADIAIDRVVALVEPARAPRPRASSTSCAQSRSRPATSAVNASCVGFVAGAAGAPAARICGW